ncbi:hypothetical protein T03_5719 [Trichinella britovi]|uniref:Uncharacterized protein n=1 Tax=Trichinella britovi TaxID=45882 RepID=A0A0V1CJU6_TRIBR|nr:hypothetical protein T03_5719 [Trichinella britovi]
MLLAVDFSLVFVRFFAHVDVSLLTTKLYCNGPLPRAGSSASSTRLLARQSLFGDGPVLTGVFPFFSASRFPDGIATMNELLAEVSWTAQSGIMPLIALQLLADTEFLFPITRNVGEKKRKRDPARQMENSPIAKHVQREPKESTLVKFYNEKPG